MVAEPPQLGDDRVQALALDKLHGVITDIAILADFVHGHDVGVMQSSGGAGLPAKPFLDQRVARHVARQDLECHPPAQRDLFGLVDDAHAAAADLAEDPEVADLVVPRDRGLGSPGERVVPF